jgi:coenzyme F420-dependent glucose-6-phosphate dehydrogenase
MTRLGYAISSEEHAPLELVRNARLAEEAGFEYALISDHFHPWIDEQGHSPFVWTIIGAIAEATERLELGTGVTAPTMRIHPAIIAQAAATAACLMPGRFFFGVGTGENLNEHILGDRWPPAELRLEMLEEAIEVMRLLWQGGLQTHYGEHYVVENARIYDLPDEPIRVMVAASGSEAADLAGRVGDGLISTSPKKELVDAFRSGGGDDDRPRYGHLAVCWAETKDEGIATAHRYWPNIALPGQLSQDMLLPSHFEQAAELVGRDDVADMVPCGPEARPILERIEQYVGAGFSHVYLHQIGPQQAEFLRFCERHILPELAAVATRR